METASEWRELESIEQAAQRLIGVMNARRKTASERRQGSEQITNTGQGKGTPGRRSAGTVCPRIARRPALILDAANDNWPWFDGLEL